MTSAEPLGTPLPVGASVRPGTLRARLEELRAQGGLLNLKQAVGIIVPLCVEIADMHRQGAQLYVHPSCMVEDEYGFYHLSAELSRQPPVLPRDRACLAPEARNGSPGGSRASVYALGAVLYELLTALSVGPGMRRPSEVIPAIPQDLEVVLSKALIGDPAHRPDDLNALAQALYNMAPSGSIRPPPADASHMDQTGDMMIDVSMSMMPPAQARAAAAPAAAAMAAAAAAPAPYDLQIQNAPVAAPPVGDATSELAQLKARLESDARPRYVVIKDGMDHGPFSAVELLQQIATHTFVENDRIRDSFSSEEREIKDWEEFAPFAEHARLHRDIKAEKAALERVVVQEARSTRGKAFIGVVIVGALLAGAAVWFLTVRGKRSDDVAIHGDSLSNVDTEANLTSSKKGGRGGGVVGRSGNYPILGGGMSCEAAQAAYVEEMNIGGKRGPADLTAGQYGQVLNRGSYLNGCGVPDSMQISICVAVQNGRAVGVTVGTNPRNPRVQGCISGAVRRLSFPSNPKLDVTRTNFQ